uniref:Uncharacterized protein n=1 Tax=Vespula pensylvanica TaxID=30213 RepID=A0A834N8K0_VESPE|nr:hypothetical protein H0235_016336 [Vespula pensylvanica]
MESDGELNDIILTKESDESQAIVKKVVPDTVEEEIYSEDCENDNVTSDIAYRNREVLREKFIIAVLLNNLPEFFNIFIMALETMTEDELILNLVRGKLIDEVLRRKNFRSDISEDDNSDPDLPQWNNYKVDAKLRRRHRHFGILKARKRRTSQNFQWELPYHDWLMTMVTEFRFMLDKDVWDLVV